MERSATRRWGSRETAPTGHKLFEDLMVKHKALLEDQKEKEKLLCLLEEVVVDGGPGTELRVAAGPE